jgi:hypothetical protein
MLGADIQTQAGQEILHRIEFIFFQERFSLVDDFDHFPRQKSLRVGKCNPDPFSCMSGSNHFKHFSQKRRSGFEEHLMRVQPRKTLKF